MCINYQLLGQRIRELRMDVGLSQALLAEFADTSPQYISHIETGRKKASLEVVVKIANVLNISIDQLLSDNLKHNTQAYSVFVGSLLSESSECERQIIMDVASALKNSLRENRYKSTLKKR